MRLNGQNGIPGVPSLRLPWDPASELFVDGVLYLAIVLLVLVYVGLRLLLITRFGRVLVGIRENQRRIDLLGYDSRAYRLAAFVLAAGIAALAGVLYAVWGNFVAPEMFNLNQAAQVVIWVIVGGKSTLIGPIVGTARGAAPHAPARHDRRRPGDAGARHRADGLRAGVPRGPGADARPRAAAGCCAGGSRRGMSAGLILETRGAREALRRRARDRRGRASASSRASCAA